MLREVVLEVRKDNVWKYFPKKIKKAYNVNFKEAELWVEAMKYPYEAGWMGYYGAKKGSLEFNVKAYLEYDEDEVLELVEYDQETLEYFIGRYYEYEREDLEESLKAEFDLDDFSYAGRSGGYLLVGDYGDYLYKGAVDGEVSVWYDDNYGDPVDEVMEWIEEVEQAIMDLTEEGPTGENWEEYLESLEELLDDVPYETSIKKGALKIIEKNYDTLEKFIEKTVKVFEKGFTNWLKETI